MSNGASGPEPERLGSLSEEAARLLGALSGWTREQSRDQRASAEQVAHGLADSLRQVNEHVATGGEDCRYCPVCQVIHAVRDTDPEVRQHLAVAASSLLHAVAGLLDTTHRGTTDGDRASGVERIDLDDADPE